MAEDKLFAHLFVMTCNEMTKEDSSAAYESLVDISGGRAAVQGGDLGCMQIYTSQFLKVLIKILHHSQQFLNLETINNMIKKMLLSDHLYIVANTLPLFKITQLFTSTDMSRTFSQDKEIVQEIFS